MASQDWSWTSYKRTGWLDMNGVRWYFGNFMRGDLHDGETVRIMFGSKHPVKALRHLVKLANAGQDLTDFHMRVVGV